MYRIELHYTYGWDAVNDEVFPTWEDAMTDLIDTLTLAREYIPDTNPDDWRVAEITQGQLMTP